MIYNIQKSSKLQKIKWDISTIKVSKDSLSVSNFKFTKTYPLQNISSLSFKDGTYWARGLLIGASIGIVLASAIYIFAKDDPETKGHPDIQIPKGAAFYLVIPCAALGTLRIEVII